MDPIIEHMLLNYEAENLYDRKNAIKEILQEILLSGLSRAGFFRSAAFYGGTALRIFYGLDRFSDDLDFSLKESNPQFNMQEYFPIMEKEIRSYGFNFQLSTKEKARNTDIHSAFIKGGTREHILSLYPQDSRAKMIHPNELIKIKLEVDTNPPEGALFENKYRLVPMPYEITLYDSSSLFAGKIHAVLCRAWRSRVKGRDLYDYVYYLSRSIPVNVEHLSARLWQSGYMTEKETMSIVDIKKMLVERFAMIDYKQAKQDVMPFIKNPSVLEIWNAEFFSSITEQLQEKV